MNPSNPNTPKKSTFPRTFTLVTTKFTNKLNLLEKTREKKKRCRDEADVVIRDTIRSGKNPFSAFKLLQKTALRSVTFLGWKGLEPHILERCRAEQVKAYLEGLAQQAQHLGKEMIVVLDNAGFHRAKLIKAEQEI